MLDNDGNTVHLNRNPNGHVLVWGQSGQGKTNFCYRIVEEEFEKGRHLVILDYSGSYSKAELEEKKFRYMEQVEIFNPRQSPYYFMPFIEDSEVFSEDLADALSSVLKIGSYYQKKLIRQCINKHLQKFKDWNPNEFLMTLQEEFCESKIKLEQGVEGIMIDDCKNIERLLTRLEPFANMRKFFVKQSETECKRRKPITIVQLSDFPELQKKFLTEFIATMLWKETRNKQEHEEKIIVLDEIQFMSLNNGSALSEMLREGRRYKLSLFLSTQFISNYDKTSMETLLQSGTKVIFKPTEKDMKFSASIIDTERAGQWKKVLQNLNIGEAVIKGSYRLNSNTSNLRIPIVCRI